MLAQFLISLSLPALHLAIHSLFTLGRKLARHLLFCAAQDEGPERLGQYLAGLFIRIAHSSSNRLEGAGGAQHPGIEKLEQGPKLTEMVFHRRTAQSQAMMALQQAHRL